MKQPFLVLLIALLWTWAPLMALDVRPFLRGRPPTVSSFTAQTASFDGSSQYIRTTSAMTGIADGTAFTCSFWCNFGADTGTSMMIFELGVNTDQKLQIFRNASYKMVARGFSSGGTELVEVIGSTDILAAGTGWDTSDGWYHVFICVNTSGESEDNCKIYINGVQETETFAPSPDDSLNIDLEPAMPRYTIGDNGANTAKANVALAEFVFYDGFHDIPSAFYSGTKPADIGVTGSTPTGSAPDIYLSLEGSGSTWAQDSSGNSNDFTVTSGPLGSPTAP